MSRDEGTLRLGLTDAGKVVLTGTGFIALTALVFPAFGVLSLLVWVLLTSLLAGFALRPKIRLSPARSDGPDCIMAGQTASLRYVLKNVGRFPAYNLCVRFGPAPSNGPQAIEQIGDEQVISRLGPGETIEVTMTIRPRRRGYYQIKQPTCQSSFPFHLFSFAASHDEAEDLIVLPAFFPLQMPARGFSRQVRAGSARPAGRTGLSTEYAGNRPFLPGDSPRQIDARAWARLSVPATKEYHDDFDCYAALVLDTAVPEVLLRSQPAQIKELEAAVSLCASIAFAISKDRLIDLLLVGPDLHRFTDRPREVRLDAIHEILAGVEPASGDCAAPTEPIFANQFREISEVIFILLNWNGAYQQLLDLAHQAGCHTTILLIGEPLGMHVSRPSPRLCSGQAWPRHIEGVPPSDRGRDAHDIVWPGGIRFLSADEILSGQVESL